MQARAFLLLLFGLVFSFGTFSQTITVLPLEGQFCSGATVHVPYSITGTFNIGNTFIVQLSDNNGSFSSPVNLGSQASVSSGTISVVVPAGLLFASQYKIRLVSTNPSASSTNVQPLIPENVDSNSWVRRRDFGGAPRAYAMAFSIGTKGYIGTGSVQSGVSSDFWEYDSDTDEWAQKSSFGGFVRSTAVAFSIGGKGYAGTGNNSKDFWEYDPQTDSWTQKATFPGVGRSSASGFSIGSKGYLGLGKGTTGIYNDFWQYDPVTNTWISKATFPGGGRDRAVGFSVNNKGFFGLGNDGSQPRSDLWQYDPQNDSWISRASYPGGPRIGSIAFSIGNKAYVGSGFFNSNKSDFYEFDPSSNTWSQKANTGGNARRYAVGFSIGSKGYISTGIDAGLKNDLWEYTPKDKLIDITSVTEALCPSSDIQVEIQSGCESFDNGNNFILQLSDSLGSFETPVNIGSLSSATGGTINGNIPSNVFTGDHYMIRVVSSTYNIESPGRFIEIATVTRLALNTSPASENQDVCINNPINTISYTFAGGQSITASGLPDGVNANISDSVLTITGNPTSASSGNTAYQVSVNGGCIPASASGNIVVKPNTSIVTEPSSSDVDYCLGLASSPLDLTSIGADLTYQWFASPTPDLPSGVAIPGATSPTYFPSTTVAGEKYYYCVVYGGCGNPDTTILSGKHNVKSNGTWLGNSSSWFDNANWCGGVPSSTTNVMISASAQDPAISGTPAICNNVTVETGATLTLDSQTLKVFGIINADGNINALSGTIEMAGNFRQPLDAKSFTQNKISHLRISNNSGVDVLGVDSLKIRNLLDFGASNCELFANDKLIIMSDELGTASIGDMTSDGNATNTYSGNQIIGNVTIERHVPNHPKAWQFLSAPAIGGTIKKNWQEGNSNLSNSRSGYGTIISSDIAGATSPALGFDIYTPAGSSMKTYNSLTGNWEGVPSTIINIDNPKGYLIFIRGDRSVTAFNQPATATTLRTSGKLYQPIGNPPPVVSVTRNKFASVGNPYASALDMTRFTLTGGVQDAYYIWDPKLTSSTYSYYGLGMYRALVRIGNGYRAIPAETGGTSYYDITNQNVKIQSGQAFFVHADSAIGDGTLTITESAKSQGSATVTRENNVVPKLFINIYAIKPQERILLDGALLVMDTAYSNQVDNQDVLKIAYGSTERLSILDGNKLLTADMRNKPQQGDSVHLVLEGIRKQGYVLQFLLEDMQDQGAIPVLVDRFTGQQVELLLSSHEYSYMVNENPSSSAQDRFFIYFKRLQPVPVTFTSISAQRLDDKKTKINWAVENETSILSYDVLRSKDGVSFEKIATASIHPSGRYSFIDSETPSSITYYRIGSVEPGSANKLSQIVKVSAVNSIVPFVVNPNPVENNIIKIECKNLDNQKLQLNLIGNSGQRLAQHSIQTTTGQSFIEFKLPASLSKGTYTLTVLTSANEIYSLPVLVK